MIDGCGGPLTSFYCLTGTPVGSLSPRCLIRLQEMWAEGTTQRWWSGDVFSALRVLQIPKTRLSGLGSTVADARRASMTSHAATVWLFSRFYAVPVWVFQAETAGVVTEAGAWQSPVCTHQHCLQPHCMLEGVYAAALSPLSQRQQRPRIGVISQTQSISIGTAAAPTLPAFSAILSASCFSSCLQRLRRVQVSSRALFVVCMYLGLLEVRYTVPRRHLLQLLTHQGGSAGSAGVIWSSLSFEPNILHRPISLAVAFRMPIPLARDEMVTFSLPGFWRALGSGFLNGGPAIDDEYRCVCDMFYFRVGWRDVMARPPSHDDSK